jgi:hypothetical protein
MASYWDALLLSWSGYAARTAGRRAGNLEKVDERNEVRFVWLTVKRRPSWELEPPRTGIVGMVRERRRCAGLETKVRLSTTGAEIRVLVLMMRWIVLTGAARTQVRLLV